MEMLEPGQLVDHYRVIRQIGRGGMGVVYLARDTQLGRKVVLKMVLPGAIGDQDGVERFGFEARVTARFNHPHIVTIFGVGEHQGSPYVALEYLEGQSLRERMNERRLSSREVMRIGRAVAEALAEAHDNRVLHRDLKPGNVYLPKDGRLRVLDFGLSKALRRDVLEASEPDLDLDATVSAWELKTAAGLGVDVDAATGEDETVQPGGKPTETRADAIIGTPPYMAPEQWLGDPLSGATDVWALGVMLFELLVGEAPFGTGQPLAIFARVCDEDAAALELPDDVHSGLGELVLRCLCRDPTARPTAREVVAELDQLLLFSTRDGGDTSPFRGLLPFTEEQAAQFYGRDEEIGAFVERLRVEPLLPVVGPSGAGKSSFVQAGVIPRLREQGRWLVLRLRPGSAPFDALASRLTQPASTRRSGLGNERGESLEALEDLRKTPSLLALRLLGIAEQQRTKVLLFIDQLEELYTLVEDEVERRAFLEAVCLAADDPQGPLRVIFTLRDDFLGRVAETATARAALGHITVLRSPGPAALRETLERPVAAQGYAFEDPQLVGEMVEAVRDEPASLPLLQFTCARLWERRDQERRRLTRRAYEELGGVEGSLAQHADELIDGLSQGQMRAARTMLLRLVTPESTRRVVSRAELLAELDEGADAVLDRLVKGRVVLVRKGRQSGAEIELAHESLIARWMRLARWLEESREEVVFLAEVGQAAELWVRRGRLADEVWQGEALHEALARAARCETLTPLVREFLERGRAREERAQKRRRTLIAVVIVALSLFGVVLSLLTLTAQDARSREARAREHAEVQRAEALREGAQAAFERGDLIEARARLRSAFEAFDSPRARALWLQLRSNPLQSKIAVPMRVAFVDFSPDGDRLVTGGEGPITVIDVETGGVLKVLRGSPSTVGAVAFGPDGRFVYSGDHEGAVKRWSLEDGEILELGRHGAAIDGIALSRDGEFMATPSSDKTARLWSLGGEPSFQTLRGHEHSLLRIALSREAKLVATASFDGTVRLWKRGEEASLAVFPGHGALVFGVAFSPSGELLASSGWDKTLRLWDTRRLTETRVIHTPDQGRDVVFTPDGRLLVQALNDASLRVWDVASGEEVTLLARLSSTAQHVMVSPDGRWLAVSDPEPSIRIWKTSKITSQEQRRRGHQASVLAVRFSPDGRQLASAGRDRTVRLWDVETGSVTRVLRGHQDAIYTVSYSPDGELLASASIDRTVRIWKARTGRLVDVLGGHDAAVTSAVFSPDGRRIASSSNDKTIRLWDVQTGNQLQVFEGHEAGVNRVTFSPDGARVASCADDFMVRVWDIESGESTAVLEGHENVLFGVDFSPDGEQLLSGGSDGDVRLWDLETKASRVVGGCVGQWSSPRFHPGGELFGATCFDGTAYLTSIAEGASARDTKVLRGHRDEVIAIDFSPDGSLVATSSDDRSVRLWGVAEGYPRWFAPALLGEPLVAFTHSGWRRLDGGSEPLELWSKSWARSIMSEARQAEQSESGETLCLLTYEDEVVAWSTDADRELFRRAAEGVKALRALADDSGCLTLDRAGQVVLHRLDGSGRIAEEATAISTGDAEIVVATAAGVAIFDAEGGLERRLPIGGGATAIARVGDALALGYSEGSIELRELDGGAPSGAHDFAELPASSVERLLAGPVGTIIVGYSGGQVGVWDLELGARLHQTQLNGPVVHLLLRDSMLAAATELGDTMTLELSVLTRPYCEVLREVWAAVPIVWESGRPLRRRLPTAGEHRCAGGSL